MPHRLESERVTHVLMESTGVYWMPVYNLLEGRDFELLVVNARHVKAVPGRKTDGDLHQLAWVELARRTPYPSFRVTGCPPGAGRPTCGRMSA